MESEKLRKLQIEELEMLKKVIDICEKNNITYYAMGGTLLGAIRHKGFIPWDDDLDIGMKRDDYEKFLICAEYSLEKPYSLHYYKNDKNHLYPYARIEDSRIVLCRENTMKKNKQNLWIDIFPLDGVPKGKLKKIIWKKRLFYLRGKRNLSCFKKFVNIKKRYKGIKKQIVWLGIHTDIEKRISTSKCLKQIDDFLSKFKLSDCDEIGNPMGGHWFKEVYPKSYYDGVISLPFENIKINAPLEYKAILTKMYGDYMQLPSEKDRDWHGISIVNETEESDIE